MSTRHTGAGRIDRDNYETSPSCDTFTVAEVMGCSDAHNPDSGGIHPDPDTLAAMTREDPPLSYRQKHALEVSS